MSCQQVDCQDELNIYTQGWRCRSPWIIVSPGALRRTHNSHMKTRGSNHGLLFHSNQMAHYCLQELCRLWIMGSFQMNSFYQVRCLSLVFNMEVLFVSLTSNYYCCTRGQSLT